MSDRPLILIAEDYEPMRYAMCRILQDDYNPVRDRHPEIRVIFVTAHSEATYVREAFGLGAQGYVLKRSLGTALIAAVEQVLAGGRSFTGAFGTVISRNCA